MSSKQDSLKSRFIQMFHDDKISSYPLIIGHDIGLLLLRYFQLGDVNYSFAKDKYYSIRF